jgi:hypothetical protein
VDTRGLYWSLEECGWVRAPCAGDALATPWSGHQVPVPGSLPRVGDLWDVLGWFPPLPGMPGQRTSAVEERAAGPT